MNIKRTNEHIFVLEHTMDLQSKKQNYLLAMQKMVQETDAQVLQINNSIVASDGDVHFIESIESIAKNNGIGITIDSLTLEDDPVFQGSNIVSLKIKAKTQGSWAGNYAFLTQVESLPFKIKIDTFGLVKTSDTSATLDPKQKGNTPSEWQTSFQIHVLKYK